MSLNTKPNKQVLQTLTTGLALLMMTAATANAQATRTWVSGVGDDANPCSRTAPCKTFAGAISKTAAAGEIDIIDPGAYGAVTITKSITISGKGSFASILASGTNGIIVNAGVNDVVTIRDVGIIGGGTGLNGVRFLGGGTLVLENVQIYGFPTGKGIDFEPTAAAQLLVTNSIIQNTGGGVLIKPAAAISTSAHLDGVMLAKNTFGLRAEDRSVVTVRNSTAAGNLNNGFLAISASQPTQVDLNQCMASGNRNGGTSSGVQSNGAQALVRMTDVVVTNNDIGLNLAGGSIASWSNNKVAGNNFNGTANSTLPLQ